MGLSHNLCVTQARALSVIKEVFTVCRETIRLPALFRPWQKHRIAAIPSTPGPALKVNDLKLHALYPVAPGSILEWSHPAD